MVKYRKMLCTFQNLDWIWQISSMCVRPCIRGASTQLNPCEYRTQWATSFRITEEQLYYQADTYGTFCLPIIQLNANTYKTHNRTNRSQMGLLFSQNRFLRLNCCFHIPKLNSLVVQRNCQCGTFHATWGWVVSDLNFCGSFLLPGASEGGGRRRTWMVSISAVKVSLSLIV